MLRVFHIKFVASSGARELFMTRFIVAYMAAAIVFLAMDAVWLSQMADRLYRPALGDLMIQSFRPAPAVIFYLIYVLGMVALAIAPAMRDGNWHAAALNGAMYGFFCYATYDLSNQATLKQWSTTLTVVDMAWGTIASCVTATAGYAAATWFAPKAGG